MGHNLMFRAHMIASSEAGILFVFDTKKIKPARGALQSLISPMIRGDGDLKNTLRIRCIRDREYLFFG